MSIGGGQKSAESRSWHILIALLLMGSILTAAAHAQPPANRLGIHLLLDDGRNHWLPEVWAEHLRYAREAVGEWGYVVQLIRSDDLDVAKWQQFMDLCAELHLTPIIRLATVYNRRAKWWEAPPLDIDGSYVTFAARYVAFLTALDWTTEPHYVIVGNEPNHGDEWGGSANPAAYARFLIDVADALHAADPNVRVLNAPFDPYTPHTNGAPFVNGMTYFDAESFMDAMVAAQPDVFARIDVWASHSYPLGPLTEPPWIQTYQVDYLNGATNPAHVEPPPGIHNRGVNGYEWELFKLATYGITNLQVMITETGWLHAESTDTDASDPAFPAAPTAAAYLDLALRGNKGRSLDYPETGWTPWLDDPRVIAIAPFALDGYPPEWGHVNWLMLDNAGNVLGTYPMAGAWGNSRQ